MWRLLLCKPGTKRPFVCSVSTANTELTSSVAAVLGRRRRGWSPRGRRPHSAKRWHFLFFRSNAYTRVRDFFNLTTGGQGQIYPVGRTTTVQTTHNSTRRVSLLAFTPSVEEKKVEYVQYFVPKVLACADRDLNDFWEICGAATYARLQKNNVVRLLCCPERKHVLGAYRRVAPRLDTRLYVAQNVSSTNP